MRDYALEFERRVEFIRTQLAASHCAGIVFGNSGGKDSALVGILCKAACENTLGLIMPCASRRNYGLDRDDGMEVAEKFNIETRVVDLTPVREAELAALEGVTELTDMAVANIAPRLRMTTLYGRRPRREPPRRRHRQRERGLRRLLHQMGRRRARLQPDCRPQRRGDIRIPRIPGRPAFNHREGPQRRPLRGPDRREGDGHHLRRDRRLYGRPACQRARPRDNRADAPRERAQAPRHRPLRRVTESAGFFRRAARRKKFALKQKAS